MNSHRSQHVSVLDINEQIELVSCGAAPSLTKTQTAELDRRLADHRTNPDDVVAWSDVKAAALAKIRQ